MQIITFEALDKKMETHPYQSATWKALEEQERRNFYDSIIDQIEGHEWLGYPIGGPSQEEAFPRCIGKKIVYWDTDPLKPVNNRQAVGRLIVLSTIWVINAVAGMVAMIESQEQITQRDIGVKEAIVGPLEIIYTEGVKSPPLPQPLWDHLQIYSASFNPPITASIQMYK